MHSPFYCKECGHKTGLHGKVNPAGWTSPNTHIFVAGPCEAPSDHNYLTKCGCKAYDQEKITQRRIHAFKLS